MLACASQQRECAEGTIAMLLLARRERCAVTLLEDNAGMSTSTELICICR